MTEYTSSSRRRSCLRRLLLLAVLLPAMPTSAGAQSADWSIGLSPGLLRGDYGADSPTDVWSVPLVARRRFADGDLTVVVPYLCVRSPTAVTLVGGTPVRTGDTRRQPDRPAAPAAVRDARATACGLGDIAVRGRYYVVDERDWLPTVAVRAHVKTPTADAARGLGTGRADGGIGLEVSRRLAGALVVMVDGGHTWVGRPDGELFRNRWWYDVGLSWSVVPGRADLSVFFEAYQAIVPESPDARDVLAVLTLRPTTNWRLQVAGQLGTSAGAADRGLTVGASRRF